MRRWHLACTSARAHKAPGRVAGRARASVCVYCAGAAGVTVRRQTWSGAAMPGRNARAQARARARACVCVCWDWARGMACPLESSIQKWAPDNECASAAGCSEWRGSPWYSEDFQWQTCPTHVATWRAALQSVVSYSWRASISELRTRRRLRHVAHACERSHLCRRGLDAGSFVPVQMWAG